MMHVFRTNTGNDQGIMALSRVRLMSFSWRIAEFGRCVLSLVPAHLTVVAELVAFLFALMRADDELQVVSVQEVLGDVGAPVAAPTSHLVGHAAVLSHRVTPKQVQDLQSRKKLLNELQS